MWCFTVGWRGVKKHLPLKIWNIKTCPYRIQLDAEDCFITWHLTSLTLTSACILVIVLVFFSHRVSCYNYSHFIYWNIVIQLALTPSAPQLVCLGRERNCESQMSCQLTIGSYISMRSSTYEACGKFGEHKRCVRVA